MQVVRFTVKKVEVGALVQFATVLAALVSAAALLAIAWEGGALVGELRSEQTSNRQADKSFRDSQTIQSDKLGDLLEAHQDVLLNHEGRISKAEGRLEMRAQQ